MRDTEKDIEVAKSRLEDALEALRAGDGESLRASLRDARHAIEDAERREWSGCAVIQLVDNGGK